MGTGNKDEYTPWPELGDITALFIDNDAAFEEQAKAHRSEAEEELAPDTGLSGCVALEPEEIQNAVAQGLQDGLTNAELLAAMAEIGTAARDAGLKAYEDWLDRMEPFMKHRADCDETGYETIVLGDSALTNPVEIRNLENLELTGNWPKLTSVNIPYRWLPKRGRCGSRKRYVKLLMSLGVPRNFANRAAETMRENHISYQQNWEQYYTVNEMFGLRPTGIRGRGIYDRENDQYELFPAYSD